MKQSRARTGKIRTTKRRNERIARQFPHVRFRVYPFRDGSRLYWLVRVFTRKADLYAFCRQQHQTIGRDYDAITITYTRRLIDTAGRMSATPILGEVCYSRNDFTAGVTAHESLHAALATMRRKKLRINVTEPVQHGMRASAKVRLAEPEEQLAILAGRIVNQSVVGAMRVGVYKPLPGDRHSTRSRCGGLGPRVAEPRRR